MTTKVKSFDKRAALKCIETKLDLALTADEAGRIGDALTLYIEAEMEAQKLAANLHPNSDEKLQERLDTYMANIVSRKELLSESLNAVLPAVPSAPPAYTEAPSLPPPPRAISCPPPPSRAPLLHSLPAVQLYSVSEEGQVSVPSVPDTLLVRQLEGGSPFLQVGEWTCPLISGETPALITGEGLRTLMVPDPVSLRPRDSVAIVLPTNLPDSEREKFLRLMSQLTRLTIADGGVVREMLDSDLGGHKMSQSDREAAVNGEAGNATEGEAQPRIHTSDLLANGIQTTSELVARGLKWSAEKGSDLIRYGSERWRAHIEEKQNGETQNEPVPVNPQLCQGARVARGGTNTAVNTSTKAVGYVGSAAKSLAGWAAPHVIRGAERVLPSSWTSSSTGRSKAVSALTVASAAISGLGTVYEAMEHAAKLVGRATADGTAGVVEARYGSQAGRVTSDVLYSVGNVGLTVHNVRSIGPKAVVKSVATHGAVACAKEHKKGGQHQDPAPQ